jgi:hypothetical protein
VFPGDFLQPFGCMEEQDMSIRKIYGGTPVGNESRCDTCTHARIIQGYAESEKIVFCNSLWDPIRIPFSVRQCSAYEDKRLPDIEDLEEIAGRLRSKSAGARAGFVLTSEPAESQPATEELEPGRTPAEAPAAPKQE